MWSHSSDISGCLKVIFSNLWVPISRSHLFFECQLKLNFERCSSIRSWRDVESSKSKFDVSKKLFWITRLRTQSSSLYSDFLFILRIQLLVCDLDKPACLHFITNSKLIKLRIANSKGLTQKFRKDHTTENHKCLTASENTAWADWSKVISHMCGYKWYHHWRDSAFIAWYDSVWH